MIDGRFLKIRANLHTWEYKRHLNMLAKVVVLRRIRRLMIVVGGGMTATPMSMPSAVNVVLRALRIVLLRSSTATVAC